MYVCTYFDNQVVKWFMLNSWNSCSWSCLAALLCVIYVLIYGVGVCVYVEIFVLLLSFTAAAQ